jgi:hypothetical protein
MPLHLYCNCARSEVQAGSQPVPTTVTPFVRVTSSTPPGTLKLATDPHTGTATVQFEAIGLGLPNVPIPTATVTLQGNSSTPPGITIDVTNQSPVDGHVPATSSPSSATFHVTLTGLPQGVDNGTMKISGAIVWVSPSPWIVKDPIGEAANSTFSVSRN